MTKTNEIMSFKTAEPFRSPNPFYPYRIYPMTFPLLSERLPSSITYNCTAIGKSEPASYNGSSYNHQSLCSSVAHRAVWASEWGETLTKEERRRLDLRMRNHDYYECGYQLYSTHRGAYVLVPKGHEETVWLFTPQDYAPVKPKAPRVLVCTTSGCEHSHITHNGSSYPCGQCEDIAKYKRDLVAYQSQVAENTLNNNLKLPTAFEPFQYMYHYNVIDESSPIWQQLNPIIVMMDDYEDALQRVKSHFDATNEVLLINLHGMKQDILSEIEGFLSRMK